MEVSDVLAGGITYPRVVNDHADEALTCASCGTYPEYWATDDWKCRRRGQTVSRHGRACELWRERIAPPPVDIEQSKEAWQRFHDTLNSILAKANEPKEEVERQTPPGLQGSTDGVVYFVDCGSLTKIGVASGRVRARMRQMDTDNPFPKTLWALMPGYMKEEKAFHRQFASRHYSGEWFSLTAEDRAELRHIITSAGGEVYE